MYWQRVTHGISQRLHSLYTRLIQLRHSSVSLDVTRRWQSERSTDATDISSVFTDYESVSRSAASDAIVDGTLLLRFTSPAGASLSVTETSERCYLCRHEPPSSWLTRSGAEPQYYRLSALSWVELADILLPLLGMGWELEEHNDNSKQQLVAHWENERQEDHYS